MAIRTAISKRIFGQYKVAVYTSVLIVITVCVMVGMALIYTSSQGLMETEIHKSNSALLAIAQSHLDEALSKVAVSSHQLSQDPLVARYFVRRPSIDLWDMNRIQTKIAVMQASNNSIHSVYLHYINTPYMITSYGVYAFDTFHDKEWLPLVNKAETGYFIMPKRDLDYIDHTQETTCVSILRCLPMGRNLPTAFLVVNLDSKALLGQVEKIARESATNLMILDHNGIVIESDQDTDYVYPDDAIAKAMALVSESRTTDSKTFSYEGSVITASFSSDSQLTFIMAQPYSRYYASIQRFSITSIVLFAITILIAVGLSLALSKQLYQPIGKLLTSTQSGLPAGETGFFQEFQMINSRFHAITSKKDELAEKSMELQPLALENITRDVMLGTGRSESVLEDRMNAAGFHPPADPMFCVIGFHIDHYKEYVNNCSSFERAQHEIVIRNLFKDLLGNSAWTPTFVVGTNPAESFLLYAAGRLIDSYDDIIKGCSRVTEEISIRLPFSVTIGIGRPQSALQDVPKSYREANIAMSYRFVIGSGQTIPFSSVNEYSDVKFNFPISIERRLCDCIRAANLARLHDTLRELFISRETSMMLQLLGPQSVYTHYVNIVFSLLHEMGYGTNDLLEELANIGIDLYGTTEIDDFEASFTDFCSSAVSLLSKKRTPTAEQVLEKTLQFIEENYQMDLTISNLSSELQYSPTHLNRMLKHACGNTFNDLLCKKRIETAKNLLATSSLTVCDIAKTTGFNCVQSFGRVFRSLEGVSPTMFRSKVQIVKNSEAR